MLQSHFQVALRNATKQSSFLMFIIYLQHATKQIVD